MSKIQRATDIYHKDGFPSLVLRGIHKAYRDKFREYLPVTLVTYYGVRVPEGRLFDRFIPRYPDDRPTFKAPNADAIHASVTEGDTVVIIGGGTGTTAVHAARAVGSKGRVVIYEGSSYRNKVLEKTLDLNYAPADIEIKNDVVETGNYLKSSSTDFQSAGTLPASDIVDGDVIEIDIEGVETDVISALTTHPETIIVETHGFRGSSTKRTKKLLADAGYQINREEPIGYNTQKAAERDAYVLTAKQ